MFYTKYRPKSFKDVIGSQTAVAALTNSISDKNFSHAYFFYGPRGVGKTTFARLLASAINCENSKNGDSCGKCDTCKNMPLGRYNDLVEIDAASNRGIDDIRNIKEKINLAPSVGKYKIYIIDEVHMLTKEAFNALLKTLEEPPKHAVFILCTTEYKKVPDTIKSRCQSFGFKRVAVEDIVSKLEYILEVEQKEAKALPKVTQEELKQIAKAAQGGFRDAETMLEQVVYGGVTVKEILSQSDYEEMGELCELMLIKLDKKDGFKALLKVRQTGIDLEGWTDGLLEFLRLVLLCEAGVEEEFISDNALKFAVIKEISSKTNSSTVSYAIKKFMEAKDFMKFAENDLLPLEVALAEVVDFISNQNSDSGSESGMTKSKGPGMTGGGKNISNESKYQDNDGDDDDDIADVIKTETKSNYNSSTKSTYNKPMDEMMKDLSLAVRPLNHSIEALLRSCKLGSFDGEVLTIEAGYSFHRERLSTATSKRILEQGLAQVVGTDARVSVVLVKKDKVAHELTDLNIIEDKVAEKAKEAWEVFDGEVPL